MLTGTIRGKQQRPSQTNSKTKARRKQKLKAEENSAFQRQGRSECELFYFVVCGRGLQNFKNNTFACCMAQTNFTEEATLENLVRLFKSFKKF